MLALPAMGINKTLNILHYLIMTLAKYIVKIYLSRNIAETVPTGQDMNRSYLALTLTSPQSLYTWSNAPTLQPTLPLPTNITPSKINPQPRKRVFIIKVTASCVTMHDISIKGIFVALGLKVLYVARCNKNSLQVSQEAFVIKILDSVPSLYLLVKVW